MSYSSSGGGVSGGGGGGGQSLTDRLQAAKHTLAGSAVGRAVCKSTTEELIPPKRKHVNYLVHCTSQSNISIPQMVELLLERTQTSNWIVTFKALITIHQLMNSGNERFEACIASYSQRFQLGQFWDRSSLIGFEMSSHIRKYASYLDGKREAYRVNGFDFCRIRRGREDGRLRKIPFEKLIKVIPYLQNQIDVITGFTLTSVEIMNSIICAACYLMFKDIIKLYACYNDAITTVLECFFDLKKPQCKDALDIYRGFLTRSDNVANFLRAAEYFGTQKSEIPDLKKAPESLLDALESHYASLDNTMIDARRGSAKSSDHVRSIAGIDVSDQLKAIEDEARAISLFEKERVKKQKSSISSISPPNQRTTSLFNYQNDLLDIDFDFNNVPVVASAAPASSPIDDIFGSLNIQAISPKQEIPESKPTTTTTTQNPFLVSKNDPTTFFILPPNNNPFLKTDSSTSFANLLGPSASFTTKSGTGAKTDRTQP